MINFKALLIILSLNQVFNQAWALSDTSVKVTFPGGTRATHLPITFDQGALSKLKQSESRQRLPGESKPSKFRGPLLSDIVEKAMEGVPAEGKANVDLVVLKNTHGQRAYLPRAFISKFPVLMALQKEHQGLDSIQSVIPWDTHPKVRNENMPLEALFMSGISEISLANAQDSFQAFYLKRRSDPAAVRGERIFVQACVGCHENALPLSGESQSKKLQAGGHPAVKGSVRLAEKDARYLVSYLSAFKSEH